MSVRTSSDVLIQLTPDQLQEVKTAARSQPCGICGKLPKPKESHHIDHDHKTGKIRGILCYFCNRGIGLLSDDPERLDRAARWLRRAKFEFSGDQPLISVSGGTARIPIELLRQPIREIVKQLKADGRPRVDAIKLVMQVRGYSSLEAQKVVDGVYKS